MFNLMRGITYIFGTGLSSSFLCGISAFFTTVANFFGKIFNFLYSIMWEVIKFVLGILEALELMINNFLGIEYNPDEGRYDAINAEEVVKFAKEREFFNDLVTVFKGLLLASIILLFIFTIYAIIKNEITNASKGFAQNEKTGKPHNQVGPVILNMFKHMLMMLTLPLIMLFLVQGVNSVLASFRNAFTQATGTTIAGQVLASSTFDANKYRTYANANQRIPIIIEVYDSDEYEDDEKDKLLADIQKVNVQKDLRNIAINLSENKFVDFADSVVYENNKLYNSARFDMQFETFVCTAEQYTAMADFVDYAQLYNIKYYVRSMDDVNIDWGYVSSTIYNKTENSLTITYSDGSDIDKDGSKNDSYELVLAPQTEVTSPVSDALDSIMAMLGIGEYGDNVYKVMERDDSGEFLNLVDWQNEKCILKFSEHFNFENSNTWTDTDQIIIYEYYHYPENNTLGAYSRSDFDYEGEGVEVPVYQIAYKTYIPEIDGYSAEKYMEVINLNGNYYKVKKSNTLTDMYGNAYYELITLNQAGALGSNIHFLNPNYSVLQKTEDKVKLECSSDDFELVNNPDSWNLVDQVLIYEYYSDLSVSNDFGKYTFADIIENGVEVAVYNISDSLKEINENNQVVDDNGFVTTPYALINGTFYELHKSGSTYKMGYQGIDYASDYLIDSSTANRTYYKYSILSSALNIADETYGFTDTLNTPESFMVNSTSVVTFTPLTSNDVYFDKYSNFVLQFSENFKYTNPDTWSYKDYFVFYLYANYKVGNGIDAIRLMGVEGEIGKATLTDSSTKYVFKTKEKVSGPSITDNYLYLDLETAINISELNVCESLDYTTTLVNNNFDNFDDNLFVSFEPTTDDIKIIEITSTLFSFSDGFVPEDVTSWTVGDYVLYYMSKMGLINELSMLQDVGYQALTYEVKNNAGETDVLYAFGRVNSSIDLDVPGITQTDINSKYQNVLYLSKNRVLALKSKGEETSLGFKNVQNWLRTNLYTYLCIYNDLDIDDIVTTKDEILSNLYTSCDDQILTFNSLVNEIVNNNWRETYENVTSFKYKNESFNISNPTTWTSFDTLLYLLNGSMSGSYTTKVVLGNDDAKYIVVGGKAVKISAGVFEMNIIDDLTLNEKGSVKTTHTSYAQVKEYYDTNLVKYLGDKTKLKAVNTIFYEYKPTVSFDLNVSSTLSAKSISDLDIIIAINSNDKKIVANTPYRISLYTDGVFEYLRVGDAYILADPHSTTSEDRNSIFSYTQTATLELVDIDSPFENNGSYTPFTTLSGATTAKIKPIDSAIYSKTKNLESKAYPIYKFNGTSYIYIAGEYGVGSFIEYKNYTDINFNDTDTFSLGAGDATDSNEQNYIGYLYRKYYSKLKSNNVLNLSATSYNVTYTTNFNTASPQTWNPLDVVLNQNKFISGDAGDKSLSGKIVFSSDETKTYFKLDTITTEGLQTVMYVNITNICDINIESGATQNIIYKASALNTMYMQLFEVRKNDKNYDETGSVLSSYNTLNDKIKTQYSTETSGGDVNPNVSSVCDITIAANMEQNSPTTWNWLDLLYYYYNAEIRETTTFRVYLGEHYGTSPTIHARGFIEVESGVGNIYFEYTNILKTYVNNDKGTKTVNYDPSSFNLLGFIVKSLTNENSNTINIYTIELPIGGTKDFYYVKKFSNGVYYGIYGITDGSSVGFTLATRYQQADNSYFTKDENLSDPNDYARAYFWVESYNKLKDWTVADFIFAYSAGSVNQTNQKRVLSRIYKYSSTYYAEIDDVFVNLTKLADKGFINFAYSEGTAYYQLEKETDTNALINEITYGKELDGSGNIVISGRTNVVTSFENLDTAEQSYITKYDKGDVVVDSSTDINDVRNNLQIFSFSTNFDPSDFSTWTNADFILYYAIVSGFYSEDVADSKKFTVNAPYIVKDGNGVESTEYRNLTYSTTNFQTFVANGGVPAYVYYLTRTDGYGNSYTTRVINFSNLTTSDTGTYINYDIFVTLYNKILIPFTTKVAEASHPVTLSLSVGEPNASFTSNGLNFWHMTSSSAKVVDLTYKDYYYFNSTDLPKNLEAFNLLENVDATIQTEILSGTSSQYKRYGFIELKLSVPDGEKANPTSWLANPNRWTLLDYIYLYEYSKSETNLNFGYDEDDNLIINEYTASNIFYGMNFRDLMNGGNYIDIYCNVDDKQHKYIALNGNVYNIKNYITQVDTTNIDFLKEFLDLTEDYIDSGSGDYIDAIKGLSAGNYDSGRFANYFASRIQSVSISGSNEAEKVKSALDAMSQICKDFYGNPANSGKTDDNNLAQFLYGRFLQYTNGTVPANDSLAKTMQMAVTTRIDYLEGNSEYQLKDTNIKVNNCNYTFNNGTEEVTISTGTIVSRGTDKSNSFKVLYQTIEYSLNRAVTITGEIGTEPDTIIYTSDISGNSHYIWQTSYENRQNIKNKMMNTAYSLDTGATNVTLSGQATYYRYIYENTKEVYIQSLSLLPIYEIYPLVLEVSWPQKLMTDMQVLYPDLNWSTLIATDGWLDTLGEFTSAYTNGMYVSTGNSANTTAAGLVLSEFFLSCANRTTGSYANFEYNSLFDEEVLQSLMLSILGEEEFTTLKLQAEVFMEFFNVSFASILDDIAFEKAVSIVDGQVDNFVMSVYKSYLATALLSSDIGEYLYTIATRVYAEYTIYESLAQAAGDYNGYYAYMNKQYDENGNVVDAFTYGSFKELVLYENEICGNATPVFTFSMYKAYESYIKVNATENRLDSLGVVLDSGHTVSSSSSVRQKYNGSIKKYGQNTVYRILYSYVWNYYEKTYSKTRILDTDPLYCFMFETYFEIKQHCGADEEKHPIYVKEYKAYLEGSTIRWDVVKDVSITNTTQYLPKYNQYKNARTMAKMLATINFVMLDGKTLVDNGTSEDQNAFQNFLDWINIFDDEYSDTHYHVMLNSMPGTFDEYINLIYPQNVKDYLRLFNLMEESEDGEYYEAAWNKLLKMQEGIPLLIGEVNAILLIENENEKTDNGSSKIEADVVYDEILENLCNLQSSLDSYISAQQKLDKISKTSINFALGEYGQNYIPTGYEFTVDGKNYTFSTDVSAIRLAEYVMGGSYLIDYGIEAYYTDPDYAGIIQATKVYNEETGYVQTSLNVWKQLRTFAGELANYTGKLYFQSNLSDIAASKKDGVMLDDYIFGDVFCSTFITEGSVDTMKTTPEYLILKYLIQETDIDVDTFISLIFGDNASDLSTSNPINTNVPATVANLASYLNGTYGSSFNEADKLHGLLDYLYYLQTPYYNKGYYSPTGTTSIPERIHNAFKNVMSYLLVSEEQEETVAENPIVLDDITIIEFKHLLMERIVDYQQNPSETAAENSNRYIALFNLISCQFKYYEAVYSGSTVNHATYISTQINPFNIKGVSAETDTNGMLLYNNNNTYLYATYNLHSSTRNLILKLAGIANRPIEELVNLEYDNLYNRNGVYDEAMGDVFVVCTLDEVSGKYVPVMARGKNVSMTAHGREDVTPADGGTLYWKYYCEQRIDLQTTAYNNDEAIVTADQNSPAEATAYPLIARGVITADGYPTAIRMEDEELYYYRTNVIAVSEMDSDALAATSTVSEVSTIGYVKYVESSAYKRVSNQANKTTMFSSGYDLRTTISSNATTNFMQEIIQYSAPLADDYGGIDVIESITYYYQMGGQTYILLLIGLSTLLPMLFNASASVCRRILDIILLTIISPVMISMKQLDGDGSEQGMGTQAFETWKGMMTKSLLYAFSYVLGFNIYYIVIKTTIGMDFVSPMTYEKITALGGLTFITEPLLESLLMALWVIAAASFIKGAAQLFTDILVNEDGQNPFASAFGLSQEEPMTTIINGTKDAVKKVKQIAGGVKNLASSVKSGQFLNDLKNAAIQTAVQKLPGSQLIGAAVEAGHVMKDKAEAKNIEKQAVAKGVDASTAKAFSKNYVEQNRQGRQLERQRRVDSANRFMTTMGGNGKTFSNQKTIHDIIHTQPTKDMQGKKGYGWDKELATPDWKKKQDAKKKEKNKKKKKK